MTLRDLIENYQLTDILDYKIVINSKNWGCQVSLDDINVDIESKIIHLLCDMDGI